MALGGGEVVWKGRLHPARLGGCTVIVQVCGTETHKRVIVLNAVEFTAWCAKC